MFGRRGSADWGGQVSAGGSRTGATGEPGGPGGQAGSGRPAWGLQEAKDLGEEPAVT